MKEVILTLSPLLLSFQKGWMKSQEPSLPVASSVTLMAFFSNRAGRRLFTVRYLLLFIWRSWKIKFRADQFLTRTLQRKN